MELTTFFDRLVVDTAGEREARVMRDRLYETVGGMLIFAADLPMDESLRREYEVLISSFFASAPSHISLEITPDLDDSLRKKLRGESSIEAVEHHLGIMATRSAGVDEH